MTDPTIPEIYVSTDVEADGPIPGPNSMLSLGSAAYLPDATLVDSFATNLETLPGAAADPDTMRWWQERPEAWAACRQDPEPPERAMARYRDWLRSLPGKPVFVGYPASFDFLYVYWYLMRFVGESPFGFVALDLKSYAWALVDQRFHDLVKSTMPREWQVERRHSHIALEDAKEQAELFFRMRATAERLRSGGR